VPSRERSRRRVPSGQSRRSPERREVVRALRDQVADGSYQPPVDDVAAALAQWLVRDHMPQRVPRLARRRG
jgi:Anti-sigma-28 factor, FlgM